MSVLSVVLICAGGYLVISHRPSPPAAPAADPAQTVALERRDLSSSQVIGGKVGYGPAWELAGRLPGTVTWLPQPGATIRQGRQLYRVDDEPVTLFYGSLPLYRRISGDHLVGRDVKVVADNLAALGYTVGQQPTAGQQVVQRTAVASAGDSGRQEDDSVQQGAKSEDAGGQGSGTPDSGREASGKPGQSYRTHTVTVRSGEGVLTPQLVQAIRHWQQDTHRPVTGRIDIGQVEVRQGPLRVESVLLQAGATADQAVLSVTSTRKVITVMASLARAGSIDRGDRVRITLPDDRRVRGRVTAVGRSLATADGQEEQQLAVTVEVDKRTALAKIDAADVDVEFVARTVKDVLVAPVEALVSLSEGGYAVELAGGGLVAVETGMFSDGVVEITGDGLQEGSSVVVAS